MGKIEATFEKKKERGCVNFDLLLLVCFFGCGFSRVSCCSGSFWLKKTAHKCESLSENHSCVRVADSVTPHKFRELTHSNTHTLE